ncbi:MAG: SDR family oxidoreductase [Flavobacteriales bacterium]|nr:SDR family oxidoreductase [Flavobacteriales bacterium]
MKILITGCNGLIGCRLARLLDAQGHVVYGTSLNGLTNPYIQPAHYIQADLTEEAIPEKMLMQIAPEGLIHAAAITKPDACELNPELCIKTNFNPIPSLFKKAKDLSVFSVYISTDFVFSGRFISHTEETDDFPPVNVYGRSKWEAEKFLLAHHPEVAIVRTALVYGFEPLLPRSNIFTWAYAELSDGHKIRVVNDQFRTPTYADDLANGLSALIQLRKPGLFHLAGIDYLSVYDWVCMMADEFGFDKNLITPVNTRDLNEPALRPPSTRLIIDKARRELLYSPSRLEDNLKMLRNEIGKA